MTPNLRRMLAFGALSLVLGAIIRFWPDNSAAAVPASTVDNIPLAERRLANLRETVATIPGKQDALKKVESDLGAREKGLLQAETAAQAQAQLIQIFRDIGRGETPPVEIRSTEGFALRPLGDAYGEASVTVGIDCRIDQLVNILAAIAARPEMIGTSDIRVASNNLKDKTIGVHLTISGVVPRKLVPEKHS